VMQSVHRTAHWPLFGLTNNAKSQSLSSTQSGSLSANFNAGDSIPNDETDVASTDNTLQQFPHGLFLAAMINSMSSGMSFVNSRNSPKSINHPHDEQRGEPKSPVVCLLKSKSLGGDSVTATVLSPRGFAMEILSVPESTIANSAHDRHAGTRRWWPFRMPTLLLASSIITLILGGWTYVIAPARNAANASLCHANLFKLCFALRTYDDANGALPPAYINGANGNPSHSWRVLILPYLDSWGIDGKAIHEAYDFSEPWNGPTNVGLPTPVPNSRFACPCGSEQHTSLTSYVVLVGLDTLFPGSDSVSLSELPESVDPILVIEITDSDIQWTEPRDLAIEAITLSAETNSIRLSRPHAGVLRYITARGRLGVLPAGATIDEIRRLAQSGIP